ncbi:MAG: hypothetical protein FJX44_02825 [Alphaproteobacteria bacterium]|nr:hypothetical protein [Alphaproteobacteria bacterium]
MGWLRKDKDCIALVLAWAVLLQATILSFTFGLHASAFAADSSVLCSVLGDRAGEPLPVKSDHHPDMACCTQACRLACHGVAGALLVDATRILLPGSVSIAAEAHYAETLLPDAIRTFAAQPRAPPLA